MADIAAHVQERPAGDNAPETSEIAGGDTDAERDAMIAVDSTPTLQPADASNGSEATEVLGRRAAAVAPIPSEAPTAPPDRQAERSPAALPAPPVARPAPLYGPLGRQRSILAVPALSALTLGVYSLFWHRRVNREMEEFDPKLHARPGRSAAALFVPWLLGLLVTIAGAILVVAHRIGVHVPLDTQVTELQSYMLLAGVAVIPYLVVLLPFSAVAVVMTLERLRSVEEHVGMTADRQVRAVGTSLLLLVPVVGGLTLLAIEQRRLNAIWERFAPGARPDR